MVSFLSTSELCLINGFSRLLYQFAYRTIWNWSEEHGLEPCYSQEDIGHRCRLGPVPYCKLELISLSVLSHITIPHLKMVEVDGIEPTTICLQSRRSTNWAIPPWNGWTNGARSRTAWFTIKDATNYNIVHIEMISTVKLTVELSIHRVSECISEIGGANRGRTYWCPYVAHPIESGEFRFRSDRFRLRSWMHVESSLIEIGGEWGFSPHHTIGTYSRSASKRFRITPPFEIGGHNGNRTRHTDLARISRPRGTCAPIWKW